MRIDILTLFPEMLEGIVNSSIIKRAIDKNIVTINIHNYREFSLDKNKKVDDYPYGGGAGMLIAVDSIVRCLKSIEGYEKATKFITSAQGKTFNQDKATSISRLEHIIIICGHYEGIDNRILNYVDEEISIGDFILTGGELAAAVIIDSTIRLLDGALGNNDSSIDESFADNLLEYPQYTRPDVFEGLEVPKVLISGHHENIRKYRRFESLKKTYHLRPDLLNQKELTKEDIFFLDKIKKGEEL